MGKKPTVLMILDGFGLSEKAEGNAIKQARTPFLDSLFAAYPCEKGYASGLDVGLPEGQMGNSEVGHLNIGAGRIVYQDFTRISKAIEDGDFFSNTEINDVMRHCKENGTKLHLYGLLSDGGVHSHNTHLYALLRLAKQKELDQVYVHAFLDGRDTPPMSGKMYLSQLESEMGKIGTGRIATVAGRYYGMDRDNRWERVQKAYDAMTLGTGRQYADAAQCIQAAYDENITDEFVLPSIIVENDNSVALIEENDGVICFNFRPDRAREITRAFCDPTFNSFERVGGYLKVQCVCFTEYDITIPNKRVAFPPQILNNTLGEYLSELGLKQFRLAETEKYAHVTFFFNGGVEKPYEGEDRLLIPSPKVATYDLQPEMSAVGVTEALCEAIEKEGYDLIVVNYANPDMVGHTGVMAAAVKAIETIDACVEKVVHTLLAKDGQMFLCADHGNSDKMVDEETGEPFTAHTTNPVPFVLVNCDKAQGLAKGGKLSDIAPSLLDMMEIDKPNEMTGKSLLIHL